MSRKSPRTKSLRGAKMTFLGIALGIFLAAIIGVVLYALNQQHKFD